MAQRKYPNISVEDYLILDNGSTTARYEYLDGELTMQAGGSTAHSKIKMNLAGLLYEPLRKKPCRAFDSDTRLQLSQTRYVYPDLAISCDKRDHVASDVMQIRYPRVVFEVLSQSTEVIDRIKKLAYYRECPTIDEYIMVDSRKIKVEIYRRRERDWTLQTFGPGDFLTLESINVQLSIDDIYEDVNFNNTSTNDNDSF